MKKILIPFMAVAVVFSGCSLFGPTPKDIVTEAFNNLQTVDYYEYDFYFGGNVADEEDTVDIDVTYAGAQDNTDLSKPKFTMNVEIDMHGADFDNEFIDGEMRSDGEYLYFTLDDISDFNGDLSEDLVNLFKGKWYSLDLQGEILSSMSPFGTSLMTDEENMTDEQKELKKLYEDTDFFTDVEFVKTEDGYDVYSGVFDSEASKEFLERVIEMQGQSLTGDEEEEFEKMMKSIEMEIMMYIDTTENIMTKITGIFTLADLEEVDGDFEFMMEFFNLHEPVSIKAPANSEEFDPMTVFAVMMGVDPAMLEEAMMMEDPTAIDYAPATIVDPDVTSETDLSEFMSPEELEEFTKEMENALEGMGY